METIIQASELKKYYPLREGLFSRDRRVVRAVDNLSFRIRPGETLGLVGESGCGKSTVAHLVLGLIEPTGGEISVMGHDLSSASQRQLKELRRNVQVIFQDPFASLNPRRNVRQILSQPFEVHGVEQGEAKVRRVLELLTSVGFDPPEQYLNRLPHEFSGGQRQRICIARAIALKPAFIVADEPVSALDVSMRGQILNLMKSIQRELGLSYLFISHDLNVVRFISDRVAVMYLGQIVEYAPESVLLASPVHPYTKALLSASLSPDPRVSRTQVRVELTGDVPSPVNPPGGCRFHPRCPERKDVCGRDEPGLQDLGDEHQVRCHLAR